MEETPPGLDQRAVVEVLESAARLQEAVPAAVLWAGHRTSDDHDHVLADLAERFGFVLEAIEATDGWVTNSVVAGKVILGELGGIPSGIRQMIRRRPLEVAQVTLPSGAALRVPTPDETLRVKGYLIVRRNQTRDYLDVVALADRYGIEHSAAVLAAIDEYYADQRGPGARGVASQLARQLADPRPRDSTITRQIDRYRHLDARWARWPAVARVCYELATAMARARP